MSYPLQTDKEVILYSLKMRKNYIETGNVNLSAVDAINIGKPEIVKKLDHYQKPLISKINIIIQIIIDDKYEILSK